MNTFYYFLCVCRKNNERDIKGFNTQYVVWVPARASFISKCHEEAIPDPGLKMAKQGHLKEDAPDSPPVDDIVSIIFPGGMITYSRRLNAFSRFL